MYFIIKRCKLEEILIWPCLVLVECVLISLVFNCTLAIKTSSLAKGKAALQVDLAQGLLH